MQSNSIYSKRGPAASTAAGVLTLVCMVAAAMAPVLCSAVPVAAQVRTENADLRGYGAVTARFSPNEVVFSCADARHADILLGKLLADLFWDAGAKHQKKLVSVGGARVTIHVFPPHGAIVAARVGAQVIAIGAESPERLLAAVKREPRLLTPSARFAPGAEYPKYLDFYDLRAFKSYDHAMRSALDLGLETHWPFVKEYGLGGLAFQALSLGKSTAAPGAVDWAAMDYEMREAEKQRGMAVVGFAGGGEMPIWMFNRAPDSAMKASPNALIGAWGGAGAAGAHYESWSIPEEQARTTSLAFVRQLMNRYKNSPALGGWHPYRGSPGMEYGFHERTDEFWDFSPAGQNGFRAWLRDKRGFSLAVLGQRWYGDARHFSSWQQVTLPDPQSFYGGLSDDSLLLKAGWQRMDAAKHPGTAPPSADDPGWTPLAMPPSSQQDFLPWGAAYFRTAFDASAWLAANREKEQYLVVGVDIRTRDDTSVWFNGEPLGTFKSPVDTGPFSVKVTGKLRPGENTLTLRVPNGLGGFSEGKIYGPVFLTTTEPKMYPYLGKLQNARYVDFREWQVAALAQIHSAMFEEARAIDPDRPMILSGGGIEIGSDVSDLAMRYGMGAQMTGREAWYFPWWSGQGHLAGFYGTGEPSANVFGPYLDRVLGWTLSDCDGNMDLFWTLESYMKDDRDSHWFEKHKRLIRLFGKALRPNPGLVIFRSAESNLLDPEVTGYNWDLGRDELQSAHYDNYYATEWEFSHGLVQKYPVLLDSGTRFMDDKLVQAIRRYVEAGGTFIALHHTGVNGILEPNACPLAGISGFAPGDVGRNGNLRFEDNLPVFKGWEGKRLPSWGVPLKSVGLSGSRPLARWQDGSIAAGYRKLGKGRIIVLGYTAWRDSREIDGVTSTRAEQQAHFLERLLTDLGVRRTADASSHDVWARKAVVKNGLQEWLIAFNSTEKPVASDVSMHVERRPDVVRNLVTEKPTPFTYSNDGWIHIPQASFGPYETVIYGVDRPSLVGGISDWWAEKTKYWKSLRVKTTLPPAPQAPQTVPIEHWTFLADRNSAVGKGGAWMASGFHDAGWTALNTGPWNLQNAGLKDYRDVGLYRATFRVPASWSGRRIVLGLYSFDTPIVYDEGEFFVNGKSVVRYKARGWSQTLKYDVTGLIKPGPNTLAVRVNGGKMFSGVSGAVWFEPEQQADATIDLTGNWQLIRGSAGTAPVDSAVPGTPSGLFIRKDFQIPRDWTGRTVWLHVEMKEQWLGSIVVNGRPNSYNDYLHPFPLRTEIDITPLLVPGKVNRVELWPFQSIPGQGREAPTSDQRMEIDAIRVIRQAAASP